MSTNISILPIGARLREERDRLGLSQIDMATKVGVNRMSQANYEADRRSPDADYLQAAAAIGVDVSFVVTGCRTTVPDYFRAATTRVLLALEQKIGMSAEALTAVIGLLASVEMEWHQATRDESRKGRDKLPPRSAKVKDDYVNMLIAALTQDASLLRNILTKIDEVVAQHGITLQPDKHLSMTVMLFSAFRESGKFEGQLLAAAIAAAAGLDYMPTAPKEPRTA